MLVIKGYEIGTAYAVKKQKLKKKMRRRSVFFIRHKVLREDSSRRFGHKLLHSCECQRVKGFDKVVSLIFLEYFHRLFGDAVFARVLLYFNEEGNPYDGGCCIKKRVILSGASKMRSRRIRFLFGNGSFGAASPCSG